MENKRNKLIILRRGRRWCKSSKKGKFELLALMETKLKGKGVVSWSGVNVTFPGVQEMERAREGVAVLLNDVYHSVVVKSGYVSSRVL